MENCGYFVQNSYLHHAIMGYITEASSLTDGSLQFDKNDLLLSLPADEYLLYYGNRNTCIFITHQNQEVNGR